jgi:superfamily II DNA/RNA helicase
MCFHLFFFKRMFCSILLQVHGDKAQGDRDAALASFVANKTPLMFATDVAARGLDIKGVTHVVNFDMARDVESYVHRIGRTGRAGEVGESVTFWNPDYDKACAPVRRPPRGGRPYDNACAPA